MRQRKQSSMDLDLAKARRLELGVDPNRPTTAVPGSPAKLAVLARRALVGLPLWREGDLCSDDILRARLQALMEDINTAWDG